MNSWPQKLAQSVPDLSSVMKAGLEKCDAEAFLERFHAIRLETPLNLPDVDPILLLFDEWDLSAVKVGQLAFHEIPLFRDSGEIEIGVVEADPLVVCSGGGGVVVQEFGQSHLLWKVSASTAALLEALLPAANFLGARGVGLVDFDDFERARQTAETCTRLAGGESFGAFYRMLLGAYS